MAARGTFTRTLVHAPDRLYRAQMRTPYSKIRKIGIVADCYFLLCAVLSYWLNQKDGDCVTAEQMFNIDSATTAATGTGFVADDAAVQTFGKRYRLLNGANLDDVNQIMADDGFHDKGHVFNVGEEAAVNYQDEEEMRAAIQECGGSIQIAIAADQLEDAATDAVFDFLYGCKVDKATDHCTGLAFFGTAQQCLDKLNAYRQQGLCVVDGGAATDAGGQ